MDLAAMRTRAKTRFRDPTNIFVTDATWLEHINAAYREFYQAARWPFRLTSEEFTLATGTRQLDLDAGLSGAGAPSASEVLEFIADVYDATGDRALTPTPGPPNLPTRLRIFFEHQDSEPLFYSVVGDSLYAFPAPLVDHTIRVFYHQQDPAALAAGGDVPVLPERYHEALVSGAVAKAHADDANAQQVEVYRGEFLGIMEQAFTELQPRGVMHEHLRDKEAARIAQSGG